MIDNKVFEDFAKKWITNMYEEVIENYQIIDKDTDTGYVWEVFNDPEFYGISFSEWEFIKVLEEHEANNI